MDSSRPSVSTCNGREHWDRVVTPYAGTEFVHLNGRAPRSTVRAVDDYSGEVSSHDSYVATAALFLV